MFKVCSNRHLAIMLTDFWLLATLFLLPGDSCGPGRSYFQGRRAPRKMTPLVYKQHSPNLNENTLGASGPAEGRISRNDPEFKNLITNNNPDIIFKDEEGTGADRKMSQRCSEKLNALSVLVGQRWPGIKLRVTEGWDEDGFHPEDSLHYEGRAVDVTTSDRDRTKYGMLARLAIEAGFDWVHYETRGHVHCSVKSDSSLAVTAGGCFPGTAIVFMEDWTHLEMSDLQVGDKIWTLDISSGSSSPSLSSSLIQSPSSGRTFHPRPLSTSPPPPHSGNLVLTEVITFLHREPDKEAEFVTLKENSGGGQLVTSLNHLIYVADPKAQNDSLIARDEELNSFQSTRIIPLFAASVQALHHELVNVQPDNHIRLASVAEVSRSKGRGVYAPLTSHGTMLVDGFVVSCYATVADHSLAHKAMTPLRVWLGLTGWTQKLASCLGDLLGGIKIVLTGFLRSLCKINFSEDGKDLRISYELINHTRPFEICNHDKRRSSCVVVYRLVPRKFYPRGAVYGVHPYTSFLHWIAELVLDKEMLFQV